MTAKQAINFELVKNETGTFKYLTRIKRAIYLLYRFIKIYFLKSFDQRKIRKI